MQSGQPSGSPSESPSVFRSAAWVQAWIDTWGKHPAVTLIDLGGRANPLECLYITRQRIKKIIPANSLCLAGVGCDSVSTPRSEYNDISGLIRLVGDGPALLAALKSLSWQQFLLPDILQNSLADQEVKTLLPFRGIGAHIEKIEPVYAVQIDSFEKYLQQLGSNTRLVYFNRRKNLAQQGEIEFIDYDLANVDQALVKLNHFHCQRWGRPCYSELSQSFIRNFSERLNAMGGRCIMQAMQVNGEIVSILFDVLWRNTRYNLQSGFSENKYPKIALGAIHMGYGIQQAIENNHVYDFMAGTGKHSNYKARIATRVQTLASYSLERGYMKKLRQVQQLLTNKGV